MLEEGKRHPERQAQCGGAAVCHVEVRGASLGKKSEGGHGKSHEENWQEEIRGAENKLLEAETGAGVVGRHYAWSSDGRRESKRTRGQRRDR